MRAHKQKPYDTQGHKGVHSQQASQLAPDTPDLTKETLNKCVQIFVMVYLHYELGMVRISVNMVLPVDPLVTLGAYITQKLAQN
jgi:hypothetical protein